MDTNDYGQLPDWLSSEPVIYKPSAENRKLARQLTQVELAALFEPAMDKLASGIPIARIVREHPANIDSAEFLRWIHKDPTRKARYYEAQEIGAEIVASEIIAISDGENTMEDVQRSKLRIDARKFLIGVWNRKRFGEVKQVEMTGSISITSALEQARARIIEAEVVELIADTPDTTDGTTDSYRTFDAED